MKPLNMPSRMIFAIGVIALSACSTTPNWDNTFGQSLKEGVKAQQLPVRSPDSEVLIGSRELRSNVDAYMKGQSAKDSSKDAINSGLGSSGSASGRTSN